ncbi:HEAT repeat domain-containing protein [Actinoplanes bogorensis]|uniref:HEAT repeat domain-containing protein n=1 Tax=Paractinoplanes bogorensis TaxID=1610840 RepID=A0ABS5YY91_9ACTN|nr:HEAT repeat domain-containing protein [Actinoplanes bogorensis]MBU2668410.1 HEAT repeat domain-containing protein [Actinoplanes bogorensis]
MTTPGLDEVDWASMRHAYGPATGMPDLIRGLTSEKKRVRAWAQECMWSGVHHQGDVYECTLRAVPFLLEAAATPGRPGRGGVLRLLASIGSAEIDDLGRLPTTGGFWRAAQPAVAAGHTMFLELLGDRRKKVRRAATEALLVCRDREAETVAALRERLAVEKHSGVRTAILAAAGTIARRAGNPADLLDWLRDLVARSPHADVRLAALTERLRLTGDTDDDLEPTLYAMLGETDAIDLRDLREALGDRVAVRNRLLARVVREGSEDRQVNAMWAAGGAMDHWRGDYHDLMLAFTELLPRPTRSLGLRILTGDTWPLAAPVADEVFAYIDDELGRGRPAYAGQEQDFWSFEGGPIWALTTTLARLGDPRAVPIITRALEEDLLPVGCRPPLTAFGAGIAPLMPLLRGQIQRAIAAGDHDAGRSLLWNLREAGPEVLPEVLALLPYDGSWGPSLMVLTALGPAASPAAPLLRDRIRTGDPATIGNAAQTLAAVVGEEAEPELRALLTHEHSDVRRGAATGLRRIGVPAGEVVHAYTADDHATLRELGPAAAHLVPQLRADLETTRWPELVLTTLWKITGDAETYLPPFLKQWQQTRSRNAAIAGAWIEMGPAAAEAEPLLRAELAHPVRSTYEPNSRGSADIQTDEAFLAQCRRALAAVTGH